MMHDTVDRLSGEIIEAVGRFEGRTIESLPAVLGYPSKFIGRILNSLIQDGIIEVDDDGAVRRAWLTEGGRQWLKE